NKTLNSAFELAKQVKEDIDELDLEEHYVGVEAYTETTESGTEVEYHLEASDAYQELENTPKPAYFEDSYTIAPKNGVTAGSHIVEEALEDNLDSALKVDGRVVKELDSEDYSFF
ncbi:MAG: hypothetical protein ABEJ95_01675, partial [Candidatus Nanohalobium sp.]